MSRCFPFPPPGYAKKARVEDIDLLSKEKQREKKHKKEKKERSSKEGKEKKEKEKTKPKQKEKKDRKEKHKEKDKHKEKGEKADKKDPDLSSRNGEKLCSNSLQPLEPKDSKRVQEQEKRAKVGPNSLHPHEIKDSKHVQELEKRIKCDDGASRNHSSEFSAALPVSSDDKITKSQAKTPEFLTTEKPQIGKVFEKSSHKENGKESYVVKNDPFTISETAKLGQEKKPKENYHMKSNSLDFRNERSPNSSVVKSPSIVGTTLGKRKEPEKNGNLCDEEIRSKRSAKSCNEIESISGDHIRINSHGIASKDPKANGFISPRRRHEIPSKTPAAPKDNGESSERVKTPHPDSIYLPQIFSIPKLEELPESLDQDWLFGDKKTRPLTPTADVEIEEVWSKAVRIESADISAMPYVIPY